MADITGLAESIAQLTQIGNAIGIHTTAEGAAQVLRDEIYRNWQGIDPDADDSEVVATPDSVIVQPHEGQAVYIEYGTATMAPRPFIRPAIEREAIQREMSEAVAKDVETVISEVI